MGAKAEEAATKTKGVEIIVRYQDTNQIVAVVQAHDPNEAFEPGDVVRGVIVRTKVATRREDRASA